MSDHKHIKVYPLGFKDLWLWVIGIPIVSLIMPMAFNGINPVQEFDAFVSKTLVSLFFVTIHWHVDRQIMIFFRKRFSENQEYLKRIFFQSIVILTFTVGFTLFSDYVLCNLLDEILKDARPSNVQILFSSVIITVAVVSIYESILAIQMWKQSLTHAEQLKKENYRSQLESLKNQVNPHFLFNSLNTLTATIHDDPDLAVDFVQNLSKVYRYVLDTRNKEFILLEEELESIHNYIFLLEARFGEKLKVTIDLDKQTMAKYIVPLSLQMLIENAVKHNVVSTSKPLHINISKEKNGNLMVANNLQVKDQEVSSTKTGLANINKRYELLASKQIEVIQTETKFIVVLPLIEITKYESIDH